MNFLDAAHIVLKTVSEPEPLFERSSYELPLNLRVTLGRMAKADLPLRADWLLVWYIAHPEYSLRTPARRAAPEFRALFTLLFDERFPGGLKIPKPKRTLRASYTAASGAFDINLSHFIGELPDISRISRPLNVARKVVDEASMSPEFPTNPLRIVFTPEPVLIVGLGERLLKLRTELRMSRTNLANHLGASPNMIRNWERRASSPNFVYRQRISMWFAEFEPFDLLKPDEELGEYVRTRRLEWGMTQRELADHLGVAHSLIGMWERGIRSPNHESWRRLMDWFNEKTP